MENNMNCTDFVHGKNICAYTCDELQALDSSDISLAVYFYGIAQPAIFGMIAIIGLIGNLLVIIAILRKRDMHTTMNILLLNLAAADLCFIIFCVPRTAYHSAATTWQLGEIVCRLSSYPLLLSFYVTMYTLVFISLWRYMSVVKANSTIRMRTARNAGIIAGLIWVVMAIVNIPALFMHKVKRTEIEGNCGADHYEYCGISDISFGRAIYTCFFFMGYMAPLCLMSALYLCLLRYIRKHAFSNGSASVTLVAMETTSRATSNQTHTLQVEFPDNAREVSSSSHLQVQSGGERRRSTRSVRGRTQRVTRMIVLVIVAFGISWLPLQVHMILAWHFHMPSNKSYQVYRFICQCMAYSNSCINPVIYYALSRPLRISLRETLTGCNRQRSSGPRQS